MNIKPCPKCGSENVCSYDDAKFSINYVECDDCRFNNNTIDDPHHEFTIILWNMLSDYMHRGEDIKDLMMIIRNHDHDIKDLTKKVNQEEPFKSLVDNYYKLEDRVSKLENSVGDKSSTLDYNMLKIASDYGKIEIDNDPNIPGTVEPLDHQAHMTEERADIKKYLFPELCGRCGNNNEEKFTYNDEYNRRQCSKCANYEIGHPVDGYPNSNKKQLKPVNESCLFKEIYVKVDGYKDSPWVRSIYCGLVNEENYKYVALYHSDDDDEIYGFSELTTYCYAKRCPDVEYGDE